MATPEQIETIYRNSDFGSVVSSAIRLAEWSTAMFEEIDMMADWKPYTNPKDGRTGAKSSGGRVAYGDAAQKYLAKSKPEEKRPSAGSVQSPTKPKGDVTTKSKSSAALEPKSIKSISKDLHAALDSCRRFSLPVRQSALEKLLRFCAETASFQIDLCEIKWFYC